MNNGRASKRVELYGIATTFLNDNPISDGTHLHVIFLWSEGRPLEVLMLIEYSGGDELVKWQFGVDLLRDGLHARTGDGDVRVYPLLHNRIVVELVDVENPGTTVRISFHRRTVERFIEQIVISDTAEATTIEEALSRFLNAL